MALGKYQMRYNNWRRFFMALEAGHELAFLPESQVRDVPKRLSSMFFTLEPQLAGEEVGHLQVLLKCCPNL